MNIVISDATPDDAQEIIALMNADLVGTMLLTKHALPAMISRPGALSRRSDSAPARSSSSG